MIEKISQITINPAVDNKKSAINDRRSSNGAENHSDKRFPADSVEISEQGRKEYSAISEEKKANGKELSSEDKKQVEELKKTDREVKAHEQAHKAAASGLGVSGPNFEYQTGPDGKRYAVGGEVNIDTSKGSTPEETLQKARQIKAAALAPAEPSPQDRKVAAQADKMAAEARKELQQKTVETSEKAMQPGRSANTYSPDGAQSRLTLPDIIDIYA